MLRVLGTLAPFALIGCLANTGDEGMFIVNNTAPTGTTCTLTGDPSQPFLAAGVISSASPSGYFFTPLIQSRITSDPTDQSQIAQRSIQLEGVRVSISSPGITFAEPNYTALFSGTLPPGGDINVGFELVSAAAIQSVGATRTEIVTKITPFGKMGGGDITGTPFQYPITVCSDCVLNNVGNDCSTAPAATNLGNPCNPYQDGVIDCCGSGASLTCPSS